VNIWILIVFFVLFLGYTSIRAVRSGRREARRLEALFQRVFSSACPFCGGIYGPEVRSEIRISFDDDDALPPDLAARPHLSTWRVTCPRCQRVALLAEHFPDCFEILKTAGPGAIR
jgi:hypothetical protein